MAGNPSQSAKQMPGRVTVWESMRRLRQLLGRSAAMINVYQSLWNFAGERPGQLQVSFAELGADVGAMDQRTARGHIERLAEIGLVDVVDRDRRTGVVTLYLYDHRDLGRPRRIEADPQQELFESDEGTIDHEPGTTSGEWHGHNDSPTVDTVPMAGFAGRSETASSSSSVCAGVFAQKPPRKNPRAPRAERTSAEEIRNSFVDPGVTARSSPPDRDRRESCDHGTIESKKNLINHRTIEQYGSMDHGGAGVSAASGGGLDGDDVGHAEFERRRTSEQLAEAARRPQPIAGQIVAAIDRLAEREHPAEVKRRLENFIRRGVADPRLAASIVGGFADNVLLDGLREEVIFQAIEELNRAAVHTSRGGTFQAIMRRLLAERGIRQRGIRQRGPAGTARADDPNVHSHPTGHGRPQTPRAP